jgi:precorrin-6A/cobalt-precorrin-6A reductase
MVPMQRRILILGGTAEARQLAARLAPRADLAVTLSLAGRTASPAPQPVPVRTGGFGGASGLADHLSAARIDALIDATHPYAARISANAVRAATRAGVAFLALRRPPWPRMAGDNWLEVDDVVHAVTALGAAPRRVFVTLGRNELAPFLRAPQHHYLIRSVDPVSAPLALPHADYLIARGPFDAAAECALMERQRIALVVSKNSGGPASYGKIAAARALGLAVIMLRRPALPDAPSVETIDDVLAWLDHAVTSVAPRGV